MITAGFMDPGTREPDHFPQDGAYRLEIISTTRKGFGQLPIPILF